MQGKDLECVLLNAWSVTGAVRVWRDSRAVRGGVHGRRREGVKEALWLGVLPSVLFLLWIGL